MEPAADDGAVKDVEVRQKLLSANVNSADKCMKGFSLSNFQRGSAMGNAIKHYHILERNPRENNPDSKLHCYFKK